MIVRGHVQTIGLSLTVIMLLAACGRAASTGPASFADVTPDAVHITAYALTSPTPRVLVINQPEVAQSLLRAAAALPEAPTDRACPAIAGPHYELTFLQQGTTVVSATADRGGCPSVTFGSAGSSAPGGQASVGQAADVRDANDAFWQMLERDVADATPPAHPERVMIASFPARHQPATLAAIASAERATALYNAILALPNVPASATCAATRDNRYELSFTAGTDPIRATLIRNGCGTAQLLPGSVRQTDAAFWRLFDETLATVKSAPAAPSQLDLKVEPPATGPDGTAHASFVPASDVVQRLYAAVFALPPLPSNPTCDTTLGTRYGLTFEASDGSGGIELLSVLADKSGCGTVDFGDGDVRLANQAFWDLVSQADHA
jgi:hypothetical protein